MIKNNEVRFCTHAQVCADDQVIRATSPHTAPVRGPCHPHGAATAMGLRGSFGLWRRGRRWWWWWNWNTHTYRQRTGRGRGVWGAAAPKLIALYWTGKFSQDPHDDTFSWQFILFMWYFSQTHTQTPFHWYICRFQKPHIPKEFKATNMCTYLVLCIQESVRSCSGSALALHTSAAGKRIARSPVWLGYPAPGTHPRSECQHSCCHGNTGKVTEIAWLSNQKSWELVPNRENWAMSETKDYIYNSPIYKRTQFCYPSVQLCLCAYLWHTQLNYLQKQSNLMRYKITPYVHAFFSIDLCLLLTCAGRSSPEPCRWCTFLEWLTDAPTVVQRYGPAPWYWEAKSLPPTAGSWA